MLQRSIIWTALLGAATLSTSAQTVMNLDATQRGPVISNYQYGLFFEEINHAGEGSMPSW